MTSTFPIIVIISTAMGFLAGIGIGGGSLLIMYLTLIINLPYPQAKVLNLLFFLPSAIITSLFRWKQKKLDLKKVLPAILTGCISAGIFSWIGIRADLGLLKKGFGILLVLTGLRELLYKVNKTENGEDS